MMHFPKSLLTGLSCAATAALITVTAVVPAQANVAERTVKQACGSDVNVVVASGSGGSGTKTTLFGCFEVTKRLGSFYVPANVDYKISSPNGTIHINRTTGHWYDMNGQWVRHPGTTTVDIQR